MADAKCAYQCEREWFKKQYEREIGAPPKLSDNMQETIKSIEKKPVNRKIYIRDLHSCQADLPPVLPMKWKSELTTKCSCPMMKCICRGNTLMKAIDMPSGKRTGRGLVKRLKKLFCFYKPPLPAGTFIPRFVAAVNMESCLYSHPLSNPLHPEYCMSGCSNFYLGDTTSPYVQLHIVRETPGTQKLEDRIEELDIEDEQFCQCFDGTRVTAGTQIRVGCNEMCQLGSDVKVMYPSEPVSVVKDIEGSTLEVSKVENFFYNLRGNEKKEPRNTNTVMTYIALHVPAYQSIKNKYVSAKQMYSSIFKFEEERPRKESQATLCGMDSDGYSYITLDGESFKEKQRSSYRVETPEESLIKLYCTGTKNSLKSSTLNSDTSYQSSIMKRKANYRSRWNTSKVSFNFDIMESTILENENSDTETDGEELKGEIEKGKETKMDQSCCIAVDNDITQFKDGKINDMCPEYGLSQSKEIQKQEYHSKETQEPQLKESRSKHTQSDVWYSLVRKTDSSEIESSLCLNNCDNTENVTKEPRCKKCYKRIVFKRKNNVEGKLAKGALKMLIVNSNSSHRVDKAEVIGESSSNVQTKQALSKSYGMREFKTNISKIGRDMFSLFSDIIERIPPRKQWSDATNDILAQSSNKCLTSDSHSLKMTVVDVSSSQKLDADQSSHLRADKNNHYPDITELSKILNLKELKGNISKFGKDMYSLLSGDIRDDTTLQKPRDNFGNRTNASGSSETKHTLETDYKEPGKFIRLKMMSRNDDIMRSPTIGSKTIKGCKCSNILKNSSKALTVPGKRFKSIIKKPAMIEITDEIPQTDAEKSPSDMEDAQNTSKMESKYQKSDIIRTQDTSCEQKVKCENKEENIALKTKEFNEIKNEICSDDSGKTEVTDSTSIVSDNNMIKKLEDHKIQYENTLGEIWKGQIDDTSFYGKSNDANPECDNSYLATNESNLQASDKIPDECEDCHEKTHTKDSQSFQSTIPSVNSPE